MRQLLLDTETTGFEPAEGHRVVEFAALEMIDRKLTGNFLHLYINPERNIPEEVIRIHGITNQMVADKPTFAEVAVQIIEFIQGSELIIHNAKFDLKFINYQLGHVISNAKTSFPSLISAKTEDYVVKVIDTLDMARRKFPFGKNNLNALCDKFNIDRSVREYHGALVDCKLLAEVYLALTREQVSLLNDEVKIQERKVAKFTPLQVATANFKVIEPNQVELQLHDSYLQQLNKTSQGNSLWYNRSFNATK